MQPEIREAQRVGRWVWVTCSSLNDDRKRGCGIITRQLTFVVIISHQVLLAGHNNVPRLILAFGTVLHLSSIIFSSGTPIIQSRTRISNVPILLYCLTESELWPTDSRTSAWAVLSSSSSPTSLPYLLSTPTSRQGQELYGISEPVKLSKYNFMGTLPLNDVNKLVLSFSWRLNPIWDRFNFEKLPRSLSRQLISCPEVSDPFDLISHSTISHFVFQESIYVKKTRCRLEAQLQEGTLGCCWSVFSCLISVGLSLTHMRPNVKFDSQRPAIYLCLILFWIILAIPDNAGSLSEKYENSVREYSLIKAIHWIGIMLSGMPSSSSLWKIDRKVDELDDPFPSGCLWSKPSRSSSVAFNPWHSQRIRFGAKCKVLFDKNLL